MAGLFRLWAGKPVKPDDIPLPESITHIVVHRAERDYRFLLGADVVSFGGLLFCGWGNSRKDENDRHSVMRGRRSADGGVTWQPCERISPAAERGAAYSHGIFFPHRDTLHVFLPRAGYGIPGALHYPGLRVELATLGADGGWHSAGTVIDEPFWPMGRPERTASGNWLMPGLRCVGQTALPAVAVSAGEDIAAWRIVGIPTVTRRDAWGEGGILVDGDDVVFLFRNGWQSRHCVRVAFSRDGGESWTRAVDANLPMAAAKPGCGALPDGRRYLVFNPDPASRDALAVAVSAPGETLFRSIYRIRHGKSPLPRFGGVGKTPQWAYPLACVHDGALRVVYASSKEDCVMSSIPLAALK